MILRLVISLALATLASASSVTPPSPHLRGGKTASCVVYTTPGCAFCTRAKTFLNARDVAYEEYDVSVDRSKLEEMLSRAGRSTLPQIFVGGEHIGHPEHEPGGADGRGAGACGHAANQSQ